MAKIEETLLIVKLSRLVKDGASTVNEVSIAELPATLEEIVQGLVSSEFVVEVEKA